MIRTYLCHILCFLQVLAFYIRMWSNILNDLKFTENFVISISSVFFFSFSSLCLLSSSSLSRLAFSCFSRSSLSFLSFSFWSLSVMILKPLTMVLAATFWRRYKHRSNHTLTVSFIKTWKISCYVNLLTHFTMAIVIYKKRLLLRCIHHLIFLTKYDSGRTFFDIIC